MISLYQPIPEIELIIPWDPGSEGILYPPVIVNVACCSEVIVFTASIKFVGCDPMGVDNAISLPKTKMERDNASLEKQNIYKPYDGFRGCIENTHATLLGDLPT